LATAPANRALAKVSVCTRPMPARMLLVRLTWGGGRFAQWTVSLAIYAEPTPPLAVAGFQVPAQAPAAEFRGLPSIGHLHGGYVPSHTQSDIPDIPYRVARSAVTT
jgi:hypothetical protein